VVIVTGPTSGIGKETAAALAARGAHGVWRCGPGFAVTASSLASGVPPTLAPGSCCTPSILGDTAAPATCTAAA
jgi:NAD(P)-dependent dehydrogenase (short-subunit alcohol dehydrogenase family)